MWTPHEFASAQKNTFEETSSGKGNTRWSIDAERVDACNIHDDFHRGAREMEVDASSVRVTRPGGINANVRDGDSTLNCLWLCKRNRVYIPESVTTGSVVCAGASVVTDGSIAPTQEK